MNTGTGTYTFASGADVGLVGNFNYTYTATAPSAGTYKTITVANQLMGISPSFELHLAEYYKNNAGTLSTPYIKFNACKSSKLMLPFKNGDYTEAEMDFQIFADASGNIGQQVLSE